MDAELEGAVTQLRGAPPEAIARFAIERARRPMVTTSFGPQAAAMLHLVTRIDPGIPVVWIDTGWNTAETYRFAAGLERRLRLRLHVYAPSLTRARREALDGGPPRPDDERGLRAFAREVKVEPFERAVADLEPDAWLTGIRAEETDWRSTQDIVTRAAQGLLKFAPFFQASHADVQAYLARHALPLGDPAYSDPAKALPHRECGLHREAFPVAAASATLGS